MSLADETQTTTDKSKGRDGEVAPTASLLRLAGGEASSSPDASCDELDRLITLARVPFRQAIVINSQDELVANTLRRPFPPPPSTSSTGFTFLICFKLGSIREGADLLHVFDAAAQRSCSVKLVVEPVTGLLKYTSGLRHATLHFPEAVLREDRWHHVCLIHRRPKGDSHVCRVELYLDGELKHEYPNAAWPSAPPPGGRVRAIVGSPSQLSLSSAYLFEAALPAGMPIILADLASSGYNGNFQDSLGRFLTYETSAKVNLALSRASPETGPQEAVVQVITGLGSAVFSEDRFYLCFNAADHRVLRRTSVSRGLANDVWRLGGFSLLLRLIEQSQTTATLNRSLTLFFDLVGSSWRLSEEVETSRGYDVLNYLVGQKRYLFDHATLGAFASAVGAKQQDKEETGVESESQAKVNSTQDSQSATLVNPFLFRVCMLDFQLWAQAGNDPIGVQIAHLDAINNFLRISRHRRFNAKRVAKMQVTRKILFFLSTFDNVQADDRQAMLAVEYVSTLRTSLVATFNETAIRNVSSYLVVHLCRAPGGQSNMDSNEQDVNDDNNKNKVGSRNDGRRMSNAQVALMVLEMLTELVLERPAFLRKYGSVINIRWLRIFVSLTVEPRASRLVLDIMAALVSHDPKYAEQQGNSGNITERRMRLWYENLYSIEENRCVRMRMDMRESAASAARQWHAHLLPALQQERAALCNGSKRMARTFELDPVEGPLRMRAKLRTVKEEWEDDTKAPTATTIMQQTQPPTLLVPPTSATMEGSPGNDESTSPLVGATHSLDISEDSNIDVQCDNGTIVVESGDIAQASGDAGLGIGEADTHDDKYRRIIRSLERGDVIEGVENSLRVVFIECRASLLIFGQRCFYIIDDYFQRPDGELCNVWEAPEEERDTIVMSTLSTNTSERGGRAAAAMTLVHQLEGEQQETRRWRWSELRLITMKTFLHRRTAIEIAFNDGHTCLLVLATTAQASAVYDTLASRNRVAAQAFRTLCNGIRLAPGVGDGVTVAQAADSAATNRTAGAPRLSGGSGGGSFSRLTEAVLGRGSGGMGIITQRWVERKISNFDYLMCLNTASGRTYQDITQYPIMPFVLRDYTSAHLDLDDPATYRDLSLPMGAQKESRQRQFQERYEQLAELYAVETDATVATKPFHYGTHYSTAATVGGFLIRLRPFDKIVRALQGGSFDLPDRTFSSIGHAFMSAAEGSLGDVRELIPEAFYMPEFLINANHFDFGKTQAGVTINDVELPAWAKDDPRLFIKLHRDALESEYVSQHLHRWIDLIFGYQQRGAAAVAATNCFHELSYDDGVDLQTIESPLERQAVLKTIHMFGVCPRQLFPSSPHPCRQPVPSSSSSGTESVARTPWLLMQSVLPIRTLKQSAVRFIYVDAASSSTSSSVVAKAFSSPQDYLILPHVGLSLSLGHLDGSLRFFARDDKLTVKGVAEMILPEQVTCMLDASPSSTSTAGGGGAEHPKNKQASVLLGGKSGSLIACQVKATTFELIFSYACRGHTDSITCLDHSHTWSVSVSGSHDATAIIWDNRGTYVNTLVHRGPVQCVRICRRSGLIATASGPTLHVWSINGDRIASIETGANAQDSVASLAFYEGRSDACVTTSAGMSCEDEERSLCMVFSGHRGKIIGWRCVPDYDRPDPSTTGWRLEPFHVSEHHDRFDAYPGLNPMPLITSLTFVHDTLLSGDEHGRLYAWCLPGQATLLDGGANVCLQCTRKLGMFEKRTWCGSCGGLFCAATCLLTLAGAPFGPIKYCRFCRDHLSTLVSKSPRIA